MAPSPTTPPPPSRFRELDDAFLQNQTRIWLGEVLNTRFDKDMNISDLLADGQILFGVYKVFRKMLLNEDHSSHQKFLERESVSSSEITEIFPYAKVDCFLDVCQRLGLSDIDLFTTSDVVDKRNTRKVCMCLRFLSKKARSRNLHIPDFDSVTHRKKSPVTMPTDLVGNRRRNLERGSSSPVSVSDDLSKGSRRSQQEESVDFHADNSAYKSDDDDVDFVSESVVGGDSLEESTDSSANITSPRTPDPSTVQDFSFEGPDGDENAETECMSVAESVDMTSPSQSIGSSVGDNFQVMIDHRSNHDHVNNVPNHSPIPVDWQLALEEESGGNNVVKSDDINRSSHIQLADGESADLPQASTPVGAEEDFCSYEIEPDQSVHNLCNEVEVASTNDVEAIEESVDLHITIENGETMQKGIGDNCRDIPCIEDMKEIKNPSKPHYEKSEVESNGDVKNCEEVNSKCHVGTNDLSCIEDADQIAKDEKEDLKGENRKIAPQGKPPRKMLKLIAGGTGTVAAVGVLLFWLQLRKKRSENVAGPKLPPHNPTRINASTEKRSSREKQERAATNKIYPANKLNF